MYLTPIFYPLEILAPKFQWLIKANPMYYILECFRMPIHLGKIPDIETLFGAMLSATLALFVGSWIFARKSNEFPFYI
jgi:ABC-type polysaccharide/polyol phosphate export permease